MFSSAAWFSSLFSPEREREREREKLVESRPSAVLALCYESEIRRERRGKRERERGRALRKVRSFCFFGSVKKSSTTERERERAKKRKSVLLVFRGSCVPQSSHMREREREREKSQQTFAQCAVRHLSDGRCAVNLQGWMRSQPGTASVRPAGDHVWLRLRTKRPSLATG